MYPAQIAVLSPFTRNLRHVVGVDAPLRQLAVLLVWRSASAERSPAARWVAVSVVAALCTLDWRSFDSLFVQEGIYDPISAAPVAARRMVPLQRAP